MLFSLIQLIIPSLLQILLQPFTYVLQVPGKMIRGKLAQAFNYWMRIPEDKLAAISEIIYMLHNASLLWVGFSEYFAVFCEFLFFWGGGGGELWGYFQCFASYFSGILLVFYDVEVFFWWGEYFQYAVLWVSFSSVFGGLEVIFLVDFRYFRSWFLGVFCSVVGGISW